VEQMLAWCRQGPPESRFDINTRHADTKRDALFRTSLLPSDDQLLCK
jgi:hypothetical protein